MAYLVLNDYKSYIQTQYLNQLTQNADAKRVDAEAFAIDVIKGKLRQKYDINLEFTDTLPYDPTKVYNARDRVIIDYPVWVASTSYALKACVIYQGIGYICTTANSDATFTIGKWATLGAQYTIYFAAYPSTCTYQPTLSSPNAPMFNYLSGLDYGTYGYNVGDKVFWKNKVYTCITATCNIAPTDLKQYYVYSNVPNVNVFPDSINNSTYQYWDAGTAYTIAADTLPTDTTKWVKGDNRNQQLKIYIVQLAIAELAPLIAPMNIPKVWDEKRKEALYFINEMAKGEMVVDIPLLQPKSGRRVRYGGNIKEPNQY